MGSLTLYTLLLISFQTAFVLVLSWCTLSCSFPPATAELQELTLMKLLYLYDPAACGRVETYNYTALGDSTASAIVWPVKNEVAASFRWKLKFSVTLHVLWLALGAAAALYGRRAMGFFLTVLPFTAAGATLLVSDVYLVSTFLVDVKYTGTELGILRYIGADAAHLGVLAGARADTSWLALLVAYVAARALVLWVLNYWLVLDNFSEGLAAYRALRKEAMIAKQKDVK